MPSARGRVYAWATGRREAGEPALPWHELVAYLWRRGAAARLRGLVAQWRFKRCGGRLFLGARVDVVFPRHVTLGRGVHIGAGSYINGLSVDGMQFGDNVHLRERVWIQATSELDRPGKGLVIGDGTYIGPSCIIGAGGGVSIGRNVTFGASIHILAENHTFDDPAVLIREQGVTRKGIAIEDDVWIGNAAIVLDGVRIARGAVVGAGSIVTRDVAPYTVVAGNPARFIRHRSAREEPVSAAERM